MALRGVGIDVADVRRFARLLEANGERFTRRWFTTEEAAQCTQAADPAAAFAARFAAKEAVWKAIGITDHPSVPWREIGIVSAPDGQHATVVFEGVLTETTGHAGVGTVHVEWSMTDDLAIAIALVERSLAPTC